MSFDGTEFIALDDDCVAADEPLDTFVAHALRSNVLALSALGYCATWHRHTDDEDDQDHKSNIRPYTSVAWSSVLAVPWIVDAGQNKLTTNTFYRTGQEESGVEATPYQIILEDVVEGVQAVSSTSTPAWQVDERTLEFPTQTRRRVTRLRAEVRGKVGTNAVITEPPSGGDVYRTGAGGVLMNTADSPPSTDIFDQDTGVIPNSSYRGVYCVHWEASDEYYDILSVLDKTEAFVRPRSTFTAEEQTATALRPLSYMQVRSIQCVNEYDGTWLEGPGEAYDPGVVVEGPDALRHTIQLQRLLTRPRPLSIGPNGAPRTGETAYPTGIGGVFERITASTSYQVLTSFTATPATEGPRIRFLGYVCCSYGEFVALLDPYDEDNQGTAGFDLRLRASRFKSGLLTDLETAEVSLEFVAYPRFLTASSAFLTSEYLWHELPNGAWPYKEGQLFAEDHQLMALVDIEVDLAGIYDPASNSQPITFILEGRGDASVGNDIPAPPDEAVWQGGSGDIGLTLTGYSAWEVPQ